MSLNIVRLILVVLAHAILASSSAHAEDADPKRCKYRLLGSLPLRYHGSSMGVTTEGNINGVPAVLLVDTGAYDTKLTRFATDKRDMHLGPTFMQARGIGGSTRLYQTRVKNFDVGPIKSEGRGAMLVIDEMGRRPSFDAIVAANFLLQLDLEVSLAEKKIKFFEPNNCRDTFLGYWDAEAVAVPLEFRSTAPQPMIDVEIDGLKLRAMIDTGAGRTIISLPALKKLGLTADSPGMTAMSDGAGVGGKLARSFSYRFKQFSVGSEMIQNPEISVGDFELEGFDMLLGNDFMRSHRILLASSQNKVYLSYIGGPPFSTGKQEDWIQKEAEEGNADAQYHLAMALRGAPAQAQAWLDKAIAQGNPLALRQQALRLERTGRVADALPLYERALESDPLDLLAQLDMFSMRVRAGQAAQANEALIAILKRQRDDAWPRPIADYFVGKMTLDALLKEARDDKNYVRRRQCEVYRYAGRLLAARGDAPGAADFDAKSASDCRGSLAGR
ncbi:MAG: aspartyl protease family protein [Massilia sp.]